MKDNEHETENDARNDVETAPNKQLVTTDEAMFDPRVKYFTEDGKLELQDGSNVNVEDVLFSDNTRTTLYQHASTEPSYILKNAFVANYRKDNSVSNETEEKLDIYRFYANYFLPVEPKPPPPLSVSESSSDSRNSALRNGTIQSCAILSPPSTQTSFSV